MSRAFPPSPRPSSTPSARGDAFLTITAPLVAAGGNIEDVAFIGNAAGAIKVGIVGHRSSVEKVPLVKFVTALLK